MTKENIICAALFVTYVCFIAGAVSLFLGAFIVKGCGVAVALAIPATSFVLCGIGNVVVNKLEKALYA